MPQELILPIYTTVEENPVTWLKKTGPCVFNYPFFNEGVYHTKKSLRCIQPEYSFADIPLYEEKTLLKIKGLIFHTSHCGSTLLSRMLNSSNQVRVVSETEAINGLLLSYALYHLTENKVLVHLKQIMEAYRQPFGDEKFLVFKLTSWNVFFIHLFQKLYSSVPWIYLDRNTDDVVDSLLKKGGGFAEWWDHPTPIIRKHFLGSDNTTYSKESYLIQMVERHRLFANTHKNAASCFLQYPRFILDFENEILPHFQLPFSRNEIRAAIETTNFDAKKMEKVLFKTP